MSILKSDFEMLFRLFMGDTPMFLKSDFEIHIWYAILITSRSGYGRKRDKKMDTMELDLTLEYYPTHDTVTGLVTDDGTGFNWYETVKMSGYYCDEEDCADEGECPNHPTGYWVQALREAWLANITARGMRPVIGE